MRTLYATAMWALRGITALAGLWGAKARARSRGAARALPALSATPHETACYWMHCASEGEFEQGRPVWEALMARHPDARFVLSFFSPSGYERFAADARLGEVVYLPWDTGRTPSRWVGRLSPKLALFVKYEWWLGYHEALAAAGVPTVVVSAYLREFQPFGNTWGGLWRRALGHAAQLFAGDAESARLARRWTSAERITHSGDTRVDRVCALASEDWEDPLVRTWTRGQRARGRLVLVAGSSWPAGERVLAEALRGDEALALILVPHEVDAASVRDSSDRFREFGVVTYSASERATDMLHESIADLAASGASRPEREHTPPHAGESSARPESSEPQALSRVLVVDRRGLLAYLYRYGDLAYVGGGFGAGVHSTLEPAAYGLPVAVGPRYRRFGEATALAAAGVLTEVGDATGLASWIEQHRGEARREDICRRARAHLAEAQGATARIVEWLRSRGLA